MDVTKPDEVREFVAATEKKFGRVDICVTNAGGPPSKKFLDVSIEEWRAAVDLTLMSAIYFAREVLPGMQKRKWGRLITITSMSVKQPVDGLIFSNSIRAAVTGLARTLANEFGADGITVNNVAPGYTLTDRLEELSAKRAADAGVSKEKVLEQMGASVPARRSGAAGGICGGGGVFGFGARELSEWNDDRRGWRVGAEFIVVLRPFPNGSSKES